MGLSPSGPRLITTLRRALPAVASATIATAATVLVMLALRPEPEIQVRHIVRVVEVPAESSADGTPEQPAVGSDPIHRVWAAPSPPGPHESGRYEWSLAAGLRWGVPDLELIDRLFRAGADPWRQPAATVPPAKPSGPVPYRRWLNTLLEEQAATNPQADWPEGLTDKGASL